MADKLVIVESSAKAKTIGKYLGKGYQVQASRGHVRDLPAKTFGVDVDHDFEPTYVIMPDSHKIIAGLRKASAKADRVYLAPDPDREGEAIAWHLMAALDLPEEKVRRVTFNEITRTAVRDAFEHPREIDQNLVDAQQTRRILDRIVGYELSPLISKKIVRGLSAGRVQSVALRLIVDRERERDAFEPVEYWEIMALLSPTDADTPFEAKLARVDGEAAKLDDQKAAEGLVERLQQAAWRVASIDQRDSRSKPPAPFRTSTMQQAASNRLGYNADQTMRLAQQLYEGIEIGAEPVGLITYMRTDSVQVADQALEAVRELIPGTYGADYLPAKPNTYKNPRGAQAAHEGVRPTDVTRTPEAMRPYLSDRQWKLYDLIWRRFVASQMAPARYHTTTVGVEAGPALFEAKGRRTVFDGYMHVLRPKKDGDQELPNVAVGQDLELRELTPSQHFTQPPPLYNEASLVKELEKQGIGRPSTYAPTIATLVRRNYVHRERRAFRPSQLGMVVCDMLVANFPREMDVAFTSHMEEELDEIEAGKRGWRSTLEEFYGQFAKDLEKAKTEMELSPEAVATDEELGDCPECGKPLEVKFSRRGSKFIGCTGFPDCRYTASLQEEGPEPEVSEHKCPKCGSPMLIRVGRRGRNYLACSAFPKCRNIMGLDKEGNPVELAPRVQTGFSCPRCKSEMHLQKGDDGETGDKLVCGRCRNRQELLSVAEATELTELPEEPLGYCEKCNAPMVIKRSRNGMFLGCSKYPECKSTMQLGKDRLPAPQPTREVCEKCGRPLVMRWGQYGRFLACSGFPRCRNSWKLPARLKKCPKDGCTGRLLKKASADGPYWGCTRYPECDYREDIDEAAEGEKAAKKKPRTRAKKK